MTSKKTNRNDIRGEPWNENKPIRRSSIGKIWEGVPVTLKHSDGHNGDMYLKDKYQVNLDMPVEMR